MRPLEGTTEVTGHHVYLPPDFDVARLEETHTGQEFFNRACRWPGRISRRRRLVAFINDLGHYVCREHHMGGRGDEWDHGHRREKGARRIEALHVIHSNRLDGQLGSDLNPAELWCVESK